MGFNKAYLLKQRGGSLDKEFIFIGSRQDSSTGTPKELTRILEETTLLRTVDPSRTSGWQFYFGRDDIGELVP